MLGLVAPSLARHCFDEVRKTNYFFSLPLLCCVEPRVVFTTRQLLPATKKNTYFLLFNIAILFTNNLKIDRPLLVFANLPIIQLPMTLLQINTSWIFGCALLITTTIDSLYFPLIALFFISSLWKLLSLELFNLISVDKKNSFTALQSFINTLDFD